jgi:hypothetical protein
MYWRLVFERKRTITIEKAWAILIINFQKGRITDRTDKDFQIVRQGQAIWHPEVQIKSSRLHFQRSIILSGIDVMTLQLLFQVSPKSSGVFTVEQFEISERVWLANYWISSHMFHSLWENISPKGSWEMEL